MAPLFIQIARFLVKTFPSAWHRTALHKYDEGGTIKYRHVISYGTFWYQMQEVYCEANHIPGSARPELRDADARPRPQRRVFGLHGTRLRARQHARHRYPR